jgi:ABC-type sugar transport system ATPase subunit
MTNMLRIAGLAKRYGSVRALEGANVEAAAGEIHAILGENGAGKSTMIKILAGVTPADAGEVTLDGTRLALGRPARADRAGVRTAFQELSTVPGLTVAESLLFRREPSLALGFVRRRELNRHASELLSRLGLAHIDVRARIDELGLGERQLLEVAKALRDPARVLVLDEPTSALSTEDSAWVLGQARRAADAGAVVLFITHRLAEVRAAADRLTVLRGGVDVLTGATEDFGDDELIAAMLGRRIERLYAERTAPRSDAVLVVRGLRVGGRVGPLDLDARAGEILGIGGLQGQGQRDLLMALGGARRWLDGSAELNGAPFHPLSPREALRRRVALVPEDRQREGLLLGHSVQANVTLAALAQFVRHGVLDVRKETLAARSVVARVGLAEQRLPDAANTLSGGNQQKVVLAKALLSDPLVLLLYDCTRGVDVGTKAEIFALMAELASAGATILYYSSDLSELVHMCDRVAVMVEGRIRSVLESDELSEQAILRVALAEAEHYRSAPA